VLGLIRLSPAPFLGAFSVGIARKGPCVNYRPFVEGAHDLWRLGVDQARSIQALGRVVPVAPAVGEPLPETDARHLPAQLGPEAAAGRAGVFATLRSMSCSSACISACKERATVVTNFMCHDRARRQSPA
jgi:hypothetical protein